MGRIPIPLVVCLVHSNIHRLVRSTEETTVTQQVSHRAIKRQSRSRSQRGTKVNGTHHGDNSLLKPTGIQIAIKPLPGPTNREHRKLWCGTEARKVVNTSRIYSISKAHLRNVCYMHKTTPEGIGRDQYHNEDNGSRDSIKY